MIVHYLVDLVVILVVAIGVDRYVVGSIDDIEFVVAASFD
jgi:hypothetical protein